MEAGQLVYPQPPLPTEEQRKTGSQGGAEGMVSNAQLDWRGPGQLTGWEKTGGGPDMLQGGAG